MAVDPPLIPLTVAEARPLVAPCGMETLAGHTVAMEGLLLASVMETPPAGATAANVTGKLTEPPAAIVTVAGTTMPPDVDIVWVAVTLAVALAMFGALAVIVTSPAPTPVTGTDALVLPAAKLTVAGTVATVGSVELRLAVSGAAAGAERFSVRFCVVPSLTVRLPGQKLIVVALLPPDVTCTWELAVA